MNAKKRTVPGALRLALSLALALVLLTAAALAAEDQTDPPALSGGQSDQTEAIRVVAGEMVLDETTVPAGADQIVGMLRENPVEVTGLADAARDAVSDSQILEAAMEAARQELKTDDPITLQVETYLEITVTQAALTEESAPSFALDITPLYQWQAVVGEEIRDVGQPRKLTVAAPVELTIPLPDSLAGGEGALYVRHEKNGVTYAYDAVVNDGGLTFTSPRGLGAFTVTTEKYQAAIGDTKFAFMQDAVKVVENGQTINLYQTGLDVTLTGDKEFFIQATKGFQTNFIYNLYFYGISAEKVEEETALVKVTVHELKGASSDPRVTWENPYGDVAESAWYYGAVSYVASHDFMGGTSSTAFDPGGSMDRAMVWAAIARMAGETVSGGTWAEDAGTWAAAQGISDGAGPDGTVSRAELVTMLYRYAGSPDMDAAVLGRIGDYPDSDSVRTWAQSAFAWALYQGIITGRDGRLAAGDSVTRAEAATILARFCLMTQ